MLYFVHRCELKIRFVRFDTLAKNNERFPFHRKPEIETHSMALKSFPSLLELVTNILKMLVSITAPTSRKTCSYRFASSHQVCLPKDIFSVSSFPSICPASWNGSRSELWGSQLWVNITRHSIEEHKSNVLQKWLGTQMLLSVFFFARCLRSFVFIACLPVNLLDMSWISSFTVRTEFKVPQSYRTVKASE